jgi:hypothetical protein
MSGSVQDTHLTITALILLLLIVSGVAMITKCVPVPYTVVLGVVGRVTSQLHFLPTIHISPELILLIFLPTLLFEASWNLDLRSLRENLAPIPGSRSWCHRFGGNHRSDPALWHRPELVFSTPFWDDRISYRSCICAPKDRVYFSLFERRRIASSL